MKSPRYPFHGVCSQCGCASGTLLEMDLGLDILRTALDKIANASTDHAQAKSMAADALDHEEVLCLKVHQKLQK